MQHTWLEYRPVGWPIVVACITYLTVMASLLALLDLSLSGMRLLGSAAAPNAPCGRQ